MDRSALTKLAVAGAVFCVLFLGLTTLGVYLVDLALHPEEDGDVRSEFPDGDVSRKAPDRPAVLPPRGSPSRRTAPPPPAPPEVARLIERLGSPAYRERVKAENALVAFGKSATTDLEQALTHPDPEVRWRAKEALRRIEEGGR
jgi:hypothetical protein